ncbi:MAG: ABC transporter permease [Acidobacteria bacterium]|nr:ABC transporter permease [Acidobacteriaceae bacterium]MBV9609467.1 ABC transporter permease [Acidobacteriota bacterium]
MTILRHLATAFLLALVVVSVGAPWFTPVDYHTQFRDAPSAPPSKMHWLGTDELGRDRFARVVYGTRVSLLLAPAAALLSTVVAVIVGAVAGYLGGAWEYLATVVVDLFLSLPWLFLLVAVRAMLPLNVSPLTSIAVTFALLGILGWAASARVLCASTRQLKNSGFALQARACGISGARVLLKHVLPNLAPVLLAQFWISVPVFIISEANLGVLGLGVSEPMPSWGSLLKELESFSGFASEPWKLAPLCLLIVVVSSFHAILSRQESLT